MADGETVLVVDDDASLRDTMVRALERHGYEVVAAGNGWEARQALDEAGTIDLVVMDLVLPGMEGRETANLLKAHQPGVAVVYTSGYTSQESLRSGLTDADERFLRKPFEVEELLAAVRDALDED